MMLTPLPQITGEQPVVEVPLWTYPAVYGHGICRLRVWQSVDAGRVAVVTEIPENPGMSVTNAAEQILGRLHATFPGPLVVLEHYRGDDVDAGWTRRERLDRVWLDGRRPCWQPVWPVSPGHPQYEAHALWAAVYFEQLTGRAPDIPALP